VKGIVDQVLQAARRVLPQESAIRRLYRALRGRQRAGHRLLERFAELYPRAFFVQIGSNDGIKLDPLRRHILAREWRGILIEPVPDLFAQLRRNYESCADRLRFENLAIADRDGVLPFYHLAVVADPKAEGLPAWYDALGSFRRDVIAAHAPVIPDIERRIVKRDVEAVTFDTLCRRNSVATVDLIHMDTEGYDYQLLKAIDFSRHRPRIVIYEHIHLKQGDKEAASTLMQNHGYACLRDGMDTFCLNTRDDLGQARPLLDLWARAGGRWPRR
jgi:FkbM family methyltransferase